MQQNFRKVRFLGKKIDEISNDNEVCINYDGREYVLNNYVIYKTEGGGDMITLFSTSKNTGRTTDIKISDADLCNPSDKELLTPSSIKSKVFWDSEVKDTIFVAIYDAYKGAGYVLQQYSK